MHELSVTEQVLNVTLEHARQAKAQRVIKVNLMIGELTSYVGESIQFYFDLLSKGTEAEKAPYRSPASQPRCAAKSARMNSLRIEWIGSAPGVADSAKKSFLDASSTLRASK